MSIPTYVFNDDQYQYTLCPFCEQRRGTYKLKLDNLTQQLKIVGKNIFFCRNCGRSWEVTNTFGDYVEVFDRQPVIVDEPAPVPNEQPAVWEEVIQDMYNRNDVGICRYGTPLQPFNGRNALNDQYQEELDRIVYLKQHLIEYEWLMEQLKTIYDAMFVFNGSDKKVMLLALGIMREIGNRFGFEKGEQESEQ